MRVKDREWSDPHPSPAYLVEDAESLCFPGYGIGAAFLTNVFES